VTTLVSSEDRFDVRAFARTANGSHRAELELEGYRSAPLDAETIRMLGILHDLEAATMGQLRNVLVTATHKDARVTAFLVTWAYEKFWIADALAAVIDANPSSARITTAVRDGRRGPVRRALAGFHEGTAVIAVHMTAGLTDDLVLTDAYHRVRDTARSAALSATIDSLAAVKARHTAFFRQEAEWRLAESIAARRLARREFRRTDWPLGITGLDPADRALFEKYGRS
jgi:hypothetical protein